MNVEIRRLRARFARGLSLVLWAHVPVMGAAALAAGTMPVWVALLCAAAMAGLYQAMLCRYRTAPITRYVSAVLIVGEPALLLLIFEGHPWQMDMHMYFFAMLALSLGWFDRGALLLAAAAITLHHLLLSYFLPSAVFVNEGNVARVLLHGGIVAFQTAVLIWVRDIVVQSFERISRMSDEILQKGAALEERTQEAEEAARTKSMFLANISHEIRTPINAILGFCHLLQRTALQPRQADQVGKIDLAGKALLRLINDLLDFSKNEAGQLALEARPFDLRSAIMCQVQMVSETAGAKGLDVKVELAADLPPILVGDELRLNQVVLNLLGNAIKFTDRGTITLSLRSLANRNGQAVIECTVSDTGIGMSPDQLARLFTPFTQADASTTRRFGGTGLGLTISRQIIEQMGGTIHVESVAGQGSRFTFRIRLAQPDSGQGRPEEPGPTLRGLRVLVADDNAIAREVMAEIFAGWRIDIDLAASGARALEMLHEADARARPYDLLIVDWRMPDMDGLRTLQLLRKETALSRQPATMITTGYGLEELMRQVGEDLICPVLTKPIDAARLLEALRQMSLKTQDAGAAALVTPRAAVALPAALQGQRVLLVDDNAINREIATELLNDAGLDVECAENGRVACEMIDAAPRRYGAVLMDVQMPEMDGITATRRIRTTHRADDLPIIAMTSHAYEEERRRCLDAGMVAHIAKPVDPALLVRTLAAHLKPRAAPVAIPAPGPAAAGLPERLSPFDIEAALARVNGKADLLRRLILTFADSYDRVSDDLTALIAAERLEEAHVLAHSLRGVAASLALDLVPELAGRIEQCLQRGQRSELPCLLDRLDRAMSPAVAAARSLAEQSPADPHAGPVAHRIDAALVDEVRDRLREQIRRRSLSARAGFEELADAMRMSAAARRDDPLREALQNLDYVRAAQLMDASRDGEAA